MIYIIIAISRELIPLLHIQPQSFEICMDICQRGDVRQLLLCDQAAIGRVDSCKKRVELVDIPCAGSFVIPAHDIHDTWTLLRSLAHFIGEVHSPTVFLLNHCQICIALRSIQSVLRSADGRSLITSKNYKTITTSWQCWNPCGFTTSLGQRSTQCADKKLSGTEPIWPESKQTQ